MLSNKYSSHIYVDISFFNQDTSGTGQPKLLSYLDIKPGPFLNNPSNYYLSIQRFHIDTGNLPVFIPQIQVGQPDINRTIYTITLTYEYSDKVSLNIPIPIIFYSLDQTSRPEPPLLKQDYKNKYYWVYFYQQFIDLINFHFAQVFSQMYDAVQQASSFTGITLPYGSNPPYMAFDPATYITTIFADKAYFKDNVNALGETDVRMKIFFNPPLFKLFRSLPARFMGYNLTDSKNFQILFYNTNNGTNTSTLPNNSGTGTYEALVMTQEYSTVQLWNPIESIVFTSDYLHVEPTNIGSVRDISSSSNSLTLSSDGNNANFANIITSFQVQISPTNSYNPSIDYVAVNPEQRQIDLKGESPINTLDIKGWWRTYFNELIPLELDSNCGASMLLCFRRKDYGNE